MAVAWSVSGNEYGRPRREQRSSESRGRLILVGPAAVVCAPAALAKAVSQFGRRSDG
jgi:hypothetical protein